MLFSFEFLQTFQQFLRSSRLPRLLECRDEIGRDRRVEHQIALVGRVIAGIEHLSTLPRGTGPLGFYEDAAERVPIVSVRMGDAVDDLPTYQYLSTDSGSFTRYAYARARRQDAFFSIPAAGADVCNIPVPTRIKP